MVNEVKEYDIKGMEPLQDIHDSTLARYSARGLLGNPAIYRSITGAGGRRQKSW